MFKIIYNPKTDWLTIAEISYGRKYIFREINICNENSTGIYFTRGQYLSNECEIICNYKN